METLTAEDVGSESHRTPTPSSGRPTAGSHGAFTPPAPTNESILDYAPGSAERATLKKELARQSAEVVDIPLVIGGEEVRTGKTANSVCPHDHGHVLATYHQADGETVDKAAKAAKARPKNARSRRRRQHPMRAAARASAIAAEASSSAVVSGISTWGQR